MGVITVRAPFGTDKKTIEKLVLKHEAWIIKHLSKSLEKEEKFSDLSDEEIWNYIKTGECFGKAGSYAIQGIGNALVDYYEGSLENIIGLPIDEVIEVLGEIYGMEN